MCIRDRSNLDDLRDRIRCGDPPVYLDPRADSDADRRPEPRATTHESAHEAYLTGRPVAWPELFAGCEPRRCHLPTYPFDETDHWFTD